MIDLSAHLKPDRFLALAPGARDVLVRALLGVCLREDAGLSEAARAAALDGAHRMNEQALGHGFVLTHARIDGGHDILLSVGLLCEPAPFGRGGPAHTIICALIPVQKSREYLSLMARLSRLLTAPGAEAAFRSGDADRIARFITDFNG